MQITIPTPKEGEKYAGIAIADGKTTHHVFVLPGDLAKASFDEAMAWAKEQGGDLPSPREQALLFANVPERFKPDWYWSNLQSRNRSGWAWMQDFATGFQTSYYKSLEICAVAVRREVIR